MKAPRIVQRNALVYRRTWRGSLFSSFLHPTLFLLSMGLGVGAMVDRGGAALPAGVSYLSFLAPGLLAGACMQTASFESSWPVLGKICWQRNYEAIAATPIRPADIVLGELAWVALRLTMVATVFVLVMTAFGVPLSPRGMLAIPAAVLTGVSFAAPIMAYAATRKSGDDFNVVFRFIITPLYLFSGVFFPIARLPGVLQDAAALTPLYHGVALTRGFTLGTTSASDAAAHAAFLLIVAAVGTFLAIRTFTRRLVI
jgi:lipooligosaccharide transport system permease protein